jgi:hypothetical protein
MKNTHISKTEFETSFSNVSLSDFDLYILNKYLFIRLPEYVFRSYGAQLCSVPCKRYTISGQLMQSHYSIASCPIFDLVTRSNQRISTEVAEKPPSDLATK